ncbi:hypothetical protein [Cupriavidus basilensis]|uniref:hypothetical protein n=1 Tax=Cupriavidus basilensis TaxID=68895 RepID=UPI0020A69C5E|nr:hypothetical protein [Cupriavidus basilensis]MCP3022274.1 hypothetical protein [Cupriavidus basilensis]
MKTAKIIALPRPATEAGSTEPDRITITLNADGTHSARLVGVYAEDPRIALEAIDLVVGRIEPLARPHTPEAIINLSARRRA